MCGTESVRKWLNLQGFESWFFNKQEFTERVEYLAHLSLDALEQIIVSQDPKAQSARVKAIQIVSDLANKMPKRSQDDGAGNSIYKAIASMDAVQLQAFLEKQGAKLSITATAERTKDEDVIDVIEDDN